MPSASLDALILTSGSIKPLYRCVLNDGILNEASNLLSQNDKYTSQFG